ncbi:MAG: histidine--tRNA ligase [Chitinophagales bacterium]
MSEKRIKPQNTKGTRDFLPQQVARRNYIFNVIKDVFRKYGFEEIETPAFERMETLTGKYGEEGDKLLFKILNSGDFLKDTPKEELAAANSSSVLKHIAEKGLRYDLTVPLARYVVQHQENIAFPFRRFHIGPVWRADRPQKGRYQEFYQCDADVIGSTSLINEVELTKIYCEVFERLGLKVTVRINHRKVLEAMAQAISSPQLLTQIVTAIDKLDKVKWEVVANDLAGEGLNAEQISTLENLLAQKTTAYSLDVITKTEAGQKAFTDLTAVIALLRDNANVQYDPSLARGLNYYTGLIWEVVLDKAEPANQNISMGSLGGGGRYDNLTEMFGGQNMSGVGISFGVERIYDVMEELNLFPQAIQQSAKILFVPRDGGLEAFTYGLAQQLREAGIAAEIFLGNVKKQKQFTYAEQKGIRYMAEIGADEQQSGVYRVRNTATREEQKLDINSIIALLK